MRRSSADLGLTLIETAIAIVLISILLAILLPALSSARALSFRENCHDNQRRIGQAWHAYLRDNNDQFPTVPIQPGWFYGGVRFSVVNENPFPDYNRPLTVYLPTFRDNETRDIIWCCPGDRGIRHPTISTLGTGGRTAFRSYGNSYRANAALLFSTPPTSSSHIDDPVDHQHHHHDRAIEHAFKSQSAITSSGDANGAPGSNAINEQRGLRRREITAAPSRLVLGGDATWFETAESTGLQANWHSVPNAGNILFLDGSVRFTVIKPKSIVGPVLFDPIIPGGAYIEHELPAPENAAESPPR